MFTSYSALQLGLLQQKLKTCQQSVWSGSPGVQIKGVPDMGDLLDEFREALRPFTDRTTRKQAESLLKLIEKRHRIVEKQNFDEWFALVDKEEDRRRRHDLYQEYLTDETHHILRQWQKEDRRHLGELLAALVAPNKRLEGYYEIGTRFSDAMDELEFYGGQARPLSKKNREYILAGLTKLPLRERREIEGKRLRIFVPQRVDILGLDRQIKRLTRYLKENEDDLVAKPKWDGRVFSYREQSKEVKIQDNSIIGVMLDEGEKQEWADTITIPKMIQIRKELKEDGVVIGVKVEDSVVTQKNISNAIGHFERQQEIIEFAMNSNGVMWGPPGTVKRKLRGIAKTKKRKAPSSSRGNLAGTAKSKRKSFARKRRKAAPSSQAKSV